MSDTNYDPSQGHHDDRESSNSGTESDSSWDGGDPILVGHIGAYHTQLKENTTLGQLQKLICLIIRAAARWSSEDEPYQRCLLLGFRKPSSREVKYIATRYSPRPRSVKALRVRIAKQVLSHIRHRRENFLEMAIKHAEQCKHCKKHLKTIRYLRYLQASDDKFNFEPTVFKCKAKKPPAIAGPVEDIYVPDKAWFA